MFVGSAAPGAGADLLSSSVTFGFYLPAIWNIQSFSLHHGIGLPSHGASARPRSSGLPARGIRVFHPDAGYRISQWLYSPQG